LDFPGFSFHQAVVYKDIEKKGKKLRKNKFRFNKKNRKSESLKKKEKIEKKLKKHS